ncbi:MAG: hypothetical protein K9N23_18390, partial [Akkermansiaceae bacterium]|nr:hypothetical protein [Akkermansiaceae bacterium]
MPTRRADRPLTRGLRSALSALLMLAGAGASGSELPRDTAQCVLGIADGWNASAASLVLFEKQGGVWRQFGKPWQARLGKSGLAWGLGLQPVPAGAATKREGDLRTPAGVFYIGGVWGYARTIRKHPGLFYHRVNSRDLWIEDPESESFNRHVMLDHEPATAWEKKQ